MKIHHLCMITIFCALFFPAVYAGIDLKIDGDFKNPASWNCEKGSFTRLRVDGNDFAVKLAPESKLVSKLYPVKSDKIKLEAEVRGSGMGRLSYTAFDKDGKAITFREDGIRFSAQNRKSKIKARLNIPAQAAFVAVTLEAGTNSGITFEDVDAEFEPPYRKDVPVNGTVALTNERFYRLTDLTALPFAATLAAGKDIEFELEETQGDPWQVISYNADLCRVKIEHDVDGIWPLRRYKAEIEIDAIRAGETEVVFANPAGKKVIVKLTVK
ncbi:MAG: hypothetical protein E7054_04860 [Lentisphaerae bacterium]|nr:hypothetical protein [Lentisphaerota bacterium]